MTMARRDPSVQGIPSSTDGKNMESDVDACPGNGSRRRTAALTPRLAP
jgi:hypothetical protein